MFFCQERIATRHVIKLRTEFPRAQYAWRSHVDQNSRKNICMIVISLHIQRFSSPRHEIFHFSGMSSIVVTTCLFFHMVSDTSTTNKFEGPFAQKKSRLADLLMLHPMLAYLWPMLALVAGHRFCTQTNETPRHEQKCRKHMRILSNKE